METANDIELMLQVKDDQVAAFETLYHRYQKPLANFFFRMGCTGINLEDGVQEVFMRLWRSRKNYIPVSKFTTFLFEIAKNYWINELDKIGRRPNLHSIYGVDEDNNPWCDPPSSEKIPPELLQQNELQDKIQEAISSLKEKYRIVFVLSEIQGFKYKDIADILGIPLGTVKSRMAFAERLLREKLHKYWEAS